MDPALKTAFPFFAVCGSDQGSHELSDVNPLQVSNPGKHLHRKPLALVGGLPQLRCHWHRLEDELGLQRVEMLSGLACAAELTKSSEWKQKQATHGICRDRVEACGQCKCQMRVILHLMKLKAH